MSLREGAAVMSARFKANRRRPIHASNKLAENSERLAWRAHQLAVEVADHEPNAVSHALRRAATAQWRSTFLDLPA